MVGEAIVALAAAGGAAIAQAAGTDAWAGVRRVAARLLGRGDPQREAAELVRLDQTEEALVGGEAGAGERARWEGVWQARLEMLLSGMGSSEQDVCVRQVEALVALAGGLAGEAGAYGVQAGRDVTVRSEQGSVAGAVVHVEGDLRIDHPFPPASREGSP